MHADALSPQQRRALLALAPVADRGFYLAGGSALCLHLAHRTSIDLDLFSVSEFDSAQLLRELRAVGVPVNNARSEPSTLSFDVEGVETSLMSFPHPTLEAAEVVLGVPVASLADIAAMKIEAVSSRGARKDFVDLFFICQDTGLGLAFALDAYTRRFAEARPDLLHRVKALTYFEDAELEPELLLLRPVEWQRVRAYFEEQARAWWQGSVP